jgi:hypothetical protein
MGLVQLEQLQFQVEWQHWQQIERMKLYQVAASTGIYWPATGITWQG